jgi:clan AA aspartic protease
MGIVYSKILLKNPRLPHLTVEVDALADTGSLYLCIPEHIRAKLQIEVIDEKELLLADGSVRKLPYAGPIEVRFKNRVAFTGAVVLGDEVLVGAIPMEDMDLVVVPRTRKLDVNPASPDIARSILKQNRITYVVRNSEVAQ